ncbi:hypothetical protein BU14_0234s0011 [Porphyra umbilicalis]|uniref:Uncharacterized protein n=1 Tax=Porphyra umbilicalis TaxID=2786 RepID=A0A1X6P3S4_PORUM|nr:hypothetical protein BU14_0234s0011 [Porphyra umbilicalis]|eukprot:OSX75484.1 hypothetical protein BU14_0234s0011 [Porphyra umbilicalis]
MHCFVCVPLAPERGLALLILPRSRVGAAHVHARRVTTRPATRPRRPRRGGGGGDRDRPAAADGRRRSSPPLPPLPPPRSGRTSTRASWPSRRWAAAAASSAAGDVPVLSADDLDALPEEMPLTEGTALGRIGGALDARLAAAEGTAGALVAALVAADPHLFGASGGGGAGDGPPSPRPPPPLPPTRRRRPRHPLLRH